MSEADDAASVVPSSIGSSAPPQQAPQVVRAESHAAVHPFFTGEARRAAGPRARGGAGGGASGSGTRRRDDAPAASNAIALAPEALDDPSQPQFTAISLREVEFMQRSMGDGADSSVVSEDDGVYERRRARQERKRARTVREQSGDAAAVAAAAFGADEDEEGEEDDDHDDDDDDEDDGTSQRESQSASADGSLSARRHGTAATT